MFMDSNYFVNTKIFSLLLIMTIFICLFLKHYLGTIRILYNHARDRYAELSAFLSEYIQGITIIQIFRRKKEVLNLLRDKGEKRYQSEIKAARIQYSVWAVIGFITETIFLCVVLFLGIAEVSAGALTIGQLIMLLEFIRQMILLLKKFIILLKKTSTIILLTDLPKQAFRLMIFLLIL